MTSSSDTRELELEEDLLEEDLPDNLFWAIYYSIEVNMGIKK